MTASSTRRNTGRHPGPTPPRGGPPSNQALPTVFTHLMDAMNAAGLPSLAQVLASAPTQPVPPSRRRTPRDEVATYRVHVRIAGSDPLVWRRIDLSSDQTLDRLHEVLQTVMGWTDSHLHQFGSGDDLDGPDTERYLMPFSIDEGSVGVDERTVRLDEVLVEPGDMLWYEYDFGDGWAHIIELEEVLDRGPDAPAALCLTGARACPPEDCGGVWGFADVLDTLAGPPGDRLDELHEWLSQDFDPDLFDPDAVNAALAGGWRAWDLSHRIDPQAPLGQLIDRMCGDIPEAVAAALDVVTGHVPDEPGLPNEEFNSAAASAAERPSRRGAPQWTAPELSPADRARAVRPYSQLLARVGRDGIALTQAGYLHPTLVRELAAELGIDSRWIGKANKEAQTLPVLEFRESARHLGLLRKSNNRLSLTKAGCQALDDPESLWQHIGGALPMSGNVRRSEAALAREAGSLLLLATAAGLRGTERDELLTTGLAAGGWRGGHNGTMNPLTAGAAAGSARPTWTVLQFMGLLPSWLGGPPDLDAPVSAIGAAFARSALGL